MTLGRPREGLGGLKLDEIDAANSFPMLPMARNGLKWPVMSPFFPYFSHMFLMFLQYLSIYQKSEIFGPKQIENIEKNGTDLGWFGGALGTYYDIWKDTGNL